MSQGGEEWKLPEMVQQYHSLCPLEDLTSAREKPSRAFGIKTALLKGVSSTDGQAYTLRRIDNRRVTPLSLMQLTFSPEFDSPRDLDVASCPE